VEELNSLATYKNVICGRTTSRPCHKSPPPFGKLQRFALYLQ